MTTNNNKILTHQENRFKICLFCHGKTKTMYAINIDLKEKIKCLFPNLVIDNNDLPAALCSTCRRKVFQGVTGQNKPRKKEYEKIKICDTSKFTGEKRVTRLSGDDKLCLCGLCELARKSKCKKQKKKCDDNKKNVTKSCRKCFKTIRKGVLHKCNNKSSRVANLYNEESQILQILKKNN